MDNRTKYKRWAIGALAVLGLVILLAVIIIAGTVGKTPKANQDNGRTEVATAQDNDAEKKADEEAARKKAEEEAEAQRQAEEQARQEAEAKAAAEQRAQANQPAEVTQIPKTGPEDAILPIVLIAVSAYLFALNANWFKNGVKDDK